MIRKNLITKTENSLMKATKICIYFRKKGIILIFQLWLSDVHIIIDRILYFLTVHIMNNTTFVLVNYCFSNYVGNYLE